MTSDPSADRNEVIMSTTTSRPRRKRPHPARRTRRAVGAASVGGLVVLTGVMTVAAQQDASAVATKPGAVATSRSSAHTGAAIPAAPQRTASSHSHGS